MKRIKIKLETFDDIKIFASKIVRVESEVDIIKGSRVYDAKSIMGVLNMGTLDGVFVEIHSDDEEEIKFFNELMEEFKVNED